MSVSDINPKGTRRITLDQFNELYNCGRSPADVVQEKGRLGVLFNVEGRGEVRIWWVEASGCFIEGGMKFDDALKIVQP